MTLLIAVLGAGAGIGLALMVAGLGNVVPWRRPARRPRHVALADARLPVARGDHGDTTADAASGPPRPVAELVPAAVAAAAQPGKPSAVAPEPDAVPQVRATGGAPWAAGEPRVKVQLLGPARVEVDGREVRSKIHGRPLELLCYFALHPEGASQVHAASVLWPHVQPGREVEHFANALRRLRAGLRDATGDPSLMVIEHFGGRYRIDQTLVDTDVWQLQAALDHARHVSDPATTIRALEHATASYRGVLADGAYPWTAGISQGLQTAVVDALGWLAELREQTGDQPGALHALERTVDIDPAAEESVRRLMRVQARQGRVDGVRRTYRRLATAFAELGEAPSTETTGLRDALVNAHPAVIPSVAEPIGSAGRGREATDGGGERPGVRRAASA